MFGNDGKLLVVNANGILTAVNPNGTVSWQYAGQGESLGSGAVDANGLIYFTAGNSIVALNAAGEKQWQWDDLEAIGHSSITIDNKGLLTVRSTNNVTTIKILLQIG